MCRHAGIRVSVYDMYAVMHARNALVQCVLMEMIKLKLKVWSVIILLMIRMRKVMNRRRRIMIHIYIDR